MSKESLCDSGNCHSCGSKRAEVKARYTNEIDEHDFSAITHYSILECTGCGEIYFKSLTPNFDDWVETVNPETGETEFKVDTSDNPLISRWTGCKRGRSGFTGRSGSDAAGFGPDFGISNA